MNVWDSIRLLAKTERYQNLFNAVKDLGMKLFDNDRDLSKPQSYFLNYLYTYDNLMQEIQINNISEKVLDDEIYLSAYLKYKKEKRKKDKESEKKKGKDLNLVAGKKINFKKSNNLKRVKK